MTSPDARRFSVLIPAIVSVALLTGGGGINPLPTRADTDTDTAVLLAPAAFDEASARDFVASVEQARPLFSDEFALTFTGDSLGLGLTETFYKGFPVVTVSAVTDPSLASSAPELRPGAVVIGVGPDATSGIPLKDIAAKVAAAGRPLTIKLRDPSRYFELLDSTQGPPRRVITTSYLPANTRDAGAPEQVIRVERLAMPPAEQRLRASQLLDVMEIQVCAALAPLGNATPTHILPSAPRPPPPAPCLLPSALRLSSTWPSCSTATPSSIPPRPEPRPAPAPAASTTSSASATAPRENSPPAGT